MADETCKGCEYVEEKIWETVFQGETDEHCAKCKDCDKWIDRKGKPVGKWGNPNT